MQPFYKQVVDERSILLRIYKMYNSSESQKNLINVYKTKNPLISIEIEHLSVTFSFCEKNVVTTYSV